MNIFEDLYFGQYHVALPDSEKFRKLQKQEGAFWDYIENLSEKSTWRPTLTTGPSGRG